MYKYVAKYFIPSKVYKFCSLTAMPAFIIGMITFLLSSYFVIYSLPADVEQQEIYRILFIHVPSAILSELIYLFLAVNGFIYLVWRTKISAIFLNSAISIGLIFTAIVLISGSIWGKPTWGTYWVWDARITSTFILLIQYVGLIALRSSFSSRQTTDQILSIVSIIGAVYKFCSLTAMPAFIIGMITFLLSSYFVIYSLPADVEQQEIYRILFIHVPSAILSELIYLFLAVNGFIYLVWRTKISAIFLNSAISIGLIFTAIVLISGSIWGKPTWGTYWVWDARITSTFILLIQYVGLIALRSSFSSRQTTDQILSIVSIIGAVNIPIIKFSVDWWNTLHQNASITTSGSAIDSEMLIGLPLMLASLLFLSFSIFARNIQFEILTRTAKTTAMKEIING